MSEIEIEVWADVVSPWCYIGKRRLEQAIAASAHPAEVTVTYRAYELDPDAPVGSGDSVVKALARSQGTDVESARDTVERPATLARPDGIDIDVDALVAANTFDAHRIIALGLAQGGPALQAAVLERLFSAHFSEGKAIDDHEVLQRLGAEAGLDGRRLATVLAEGDFADAVRADEDAASEIGITEVPFYLANRHLALAGTHSAEMLGQLIETAAEGGSELHGGSAGPTAVRG